MISASPSTSRSGGADLSGIGNGFRFPLRHQAASLTGLVARPSTFLSISSSRSLPRCPVSRCKARHTTSYTSTTTHELPLQRPLRNCVKSVQIGSLSSSASPLSYGATRQRTLKARTAKADGAGSADGEGDDSSSSQISEEKLEAEKIEWMQDSKLLESVNELQGNLIERLEDLGEKSPEEEFSGEEEEEEDGDGDGDPDGDGKTHNGKPKKRRKEKKQQEVSASVITAPLSSVVGEEDGAEPAVEEYKLTEEGTLTSVTVTVGEETKLTHSNLDRAVAAIGIQAAIFREMFQNFSLARFFKEFGKKEPGVEDLKFNPSIYAPKEGISGVTQWTSLELTMQRASMLRIAKDMLYLISAFSLFGAVRILEAVAAIFSSSPPNYWKICDCLNALDPLTIASLAHALRQPVLGMLEVDPTNLEQVSSHKAKFWAEMHKFYERQWKVMATLGFARLLTLIVTHLPSAEWITKKVKILWDITIALPIF